VIRAHEMWRENLKVEEGDVTHGGNRGAVEVGGVGWVGGVSEREGSVMGSEEVIDGIG
ncbi:hypothetical protein KI387_022820, partial [Taxus chinensis]